MEKLISMREITFQDYKEFIKIHKEVEK